MEIHGTLLWDHFEKMACRMPEHPAVSSGGENWSYGELLERAGEAGDRLERALSGRRRVVGIYATLDPGTVVAFLAALKAKAVAVPLDREHPREFLDFVLGETAPTLLIDPQEGVPSFREQGSHSDRPEGAEGVGSLESIAAVVWTSGSTGRPKGVAIRGEGLLQDAANRIRSYGLGPQDRVAWTASPLFAGSLQDICFTLLSGGTLLPGTLKDRSPLDVLEWLGRESVSFFRPPVSYYRHWIRGVSEFSAPGCLRTVSLGGQAVTWKDLEAFQASFPEGRTLVHRYAATEANLVAQALFRSGGIHPEKGPVPLGFPPEGKRLLILDESGAFMTQGSVGQVAVAGRNLSPGYWGRPDLTAERFENLPEGERMLLTGDLGRIRPDGQLELLGRRDGQLKVRGFRVEPAQAERALRDLPGVEDAAVVPWSPGGSEEEKVLLAYVKPVPGMSPAADSLRLALSETLPSFMIPSRFVFMSDLPRTEAGKPDLGRLPDPGVSRPELSVPFTAPEGSIEQKLAGLWEGVLGVSPVGADDDFFDLGGHSMLAVRLFSLVDKVFGKKLPLADLLGARTVRKMACLLGNTAGGEKQVSWNCLVPILVKGNRPQVFIVHGGGGNVLCFARLAAGLFEFDVYALQALGLDQRHLPSLSIEEMVKRYVDEIRDVQPKGPYRIMGYSFGSAVAFEVGLHLQESGETVSFLGILDRALPARTSGLPRANRLSEMWDRSTTFMKYAMRVAVARNLLAMGLPVPFMGKIYKVSIGYMSRDYSPQRAFRGNVAVFQTEHRREEGIDPASEAGWGPHVTGKVSVHPIPGTHQTLLDPPNVASVAEVMQRAILEASKESC